MISKCRFCLQYSKYNWKRSFSRINSHLQISKAKLLWIRICIGYRFKNVTLTKCTYLAFALFWENIVSHRAFVWIVNFFIEFPLAGFSFLDWHCQLSAVLRVSISKSHQNEMINWSPSGSRYGIKRNRKGFNNSSFIDA